MTDPFIRWYSTRYNMKPTKTQEDVSIGLWQWALMHHISVVKAVNKYKRAVKKEKDDD